MMHLNAANTRDEGRCKSFLSFIVAVASAFVVLVHINHLHHSAYALIQLWAHIDIPRIQE